MSKNVELWIHYDKDNKECGFAVIEIKTFLWWNIVTKHTTKTTENPSHRVRSVNGFKKDW